jgi:hypothetical protein
MKLEQGVVPFFPDGACPDVLLHGVDTLTGKSYEHRRQWIL